ncbi:MAG: uridine diphosphate-N-acetylglucosamine-binding protein YvcK [Candidatus Omnitrophica bacterium]|nr:uridine diphosphate-N-acetylglucosamine-binding protein YvcK [Candidatus Omnitrophota bacterium]
MKRLKWLYPGMLIKRWIFLTVFGILLVSMGFVIVILERNPENKAIAGLVIISGILCVIIAVKRILKSLMAALVPEPGRAENLLVEKIYEKRILEKGPKIVVVGGGTGLSTLLTGLKQKTSNITAIVTVADDGGSSGRLREEFDVLPPGDIRNCLVALSDSEDLLGALFQFRFSEGRELRGHNFGNLFITALSQVTGDFARAIRESSKVLAIRGNVVPATLEKVRLVAKREDGKETVGESRIREEGNSPINRLTLTPDGCEAARESVEAIREADAIILGPGSLYTSVMPNLLIEGIKREIIRSKVPKIYICNVMTEAGETDYYSVSDHVRAIIKHTHPAIINYCVGNVSRIPKPLYEKYAKENKFPVKLDENDERWLRQENITLVKAHIASMKEFVRHDTHKLSDVIVRILNEHKKK